MAEHRKPPHEKVRGRPDGATLHSPSDSGGFSLESTTVRLKSMRLRRAESEKREAASLAAKHSPNASRPDSGSHAGPSGRVRHDDRGAAVWDWKVATGEFATLSTTLALKKLEVADLQIEDHKPTELKLEVTGRDKGGGFDPYNGVGVGKRLGEASQRAGITGSASRDRTAALDQLYGTKKKS